MAGVGNDGDMDVLYSELRQTLLELSLCWTHAVIGTGEQDRNVEFFVVSGVEHLVFRESSIEAKAGMKAFRRSTSLRVSGNVYVCDRSGLHSNAVDEVAEVQRLAASDKLLC